MPRNWPGLEQRIKERVAALGFKNLAQFADAKNYRITYIYKWAAGTTPDRENLERLAKDLEVHPAWLLFGDEVQPLLRRAKKALACLVGALALATSVPGSAEPLRAGVSAPETRHYVKRRRKTTHRWWGFPDGLPPTGFPRLVRSAYVW